ncbi:MAG: YraN family protein [Candidatus Buchananbacteria bacterium]
MTYRQEFGRQGENLAKEYLQSHGYQILTQNYHTRWGELDLVAKKSGELIFVEVKTRQHGWPEEAVTAFKRAKLYKAIYEYLWQFELRLPWRLIILAIIINQEIAKPEIRWVEVD